jgi:hypothetical protein
VSLLPHCSRSQPCILVSCSDQSCIRAARLTPHALAAREVLPIAAGRQQFLRGIAAHLYCPSRASVVKALIVAGDCKPCQQVTSRPHIAACSLVLGLCAVFFRIGRLCSFSCGRHRAICRRQDASFRHDGGGWGKAGGCISLCGRAISRIGRHHSHNLRTRICHYQLGGYNFITRRVSTEKNNLYISRPLRTT